MSKTLEEFFGKYKERRFKKGQIILGPGVYAAGVSIIIRGHVKIYRISPQGDEKVELICKKGELIPISWFFRDNTDESYYEAQDPVILKKAQRSEFVDFVSSDAEAMTAVLVRFSSLAQLMLERIETLESTRAYGRLITMLLHLSSRFGKTQEERTVIDVTLTQSDIADAINTSRETASREIKGLIKKGLILYTKRKITIPDTKKLKRELLGSSF